jgi:hypothetical protein
MGDSGEGVCDFVSACEGRQGGDRGERVVVVAFPAVGAFRVANPEGEGSGESVESAEFAAGRVWYGGVDSV